MIPEVNRERNFRILVFPPESYRRVRGPACAMKHEVELEALIHTAMFLPEIILEMK